VRDGAYAVISLLHKFHGDALTQELSEGDLDRARYATHFYCLIPLRSAELSCVCVCVCVCVVCVSCVQIE
jgi:hypothetical protein